MGGDSSFTVTAPGLDGPFVGFVGCGNEVL